MALENEYGYTQDGKIFIKAYSTFPDRQIGVVHNSEEESIQYFIKRFELAVKKVTDLADQIINAQNKGSYLTKVIQTRVALINFDGLGNFMPLFAKLDEMQAYLESLITVNQTKNLEIKNALIEDVKQIDSIEDWKEATLKVQDLKTKWLKTGPVEKEQDIALENEFNQHCDDFFQRRRDFFLIKNKEIDERIEHIQDVIEKTFALRFAEDIDAAFEQIKEYQNEFKNAGEVPPKRKKALWKNFKKANDLFFDVYNKAKGIVPKPRLDVYQQALVNLAIKAESLVNVAPEKYVEASAEAKQFLIEWKSVAPKVKYIDKTLAENFRNACDKVFEMNYLVRVIGYRHPEFSGKPRIEQLKIMINQMDYLVRKEKNELDIAIFNRESLRTTDEEDRQNLLKINTQKRKIAMKEILLDSFKKELEVILNN
jgi:hypothetical protein